MHSAQARSTRSSPSLFTLSVIKRPNMVVLIAALAFGASACKGQQKERNEPVAEPAKSAVSPPPAPVASPLVEDETFRLEMTAGGPLKAGEAGAVEVTLVPKAPYKSNAEYPYKFKVDPSPATGDAPSLIKREVMTVTDEKTHFKLPITPAEAGKQRVSGTFSFSVCTEEKCLIERKKLALDLDVE